MKMQELEVLKQNLEFIKEYLKNVDEPIFIELIGTPKSGKTTLLNHLKNLFKNSGVNFYSRQETAEYNPIENKNCEEYNIWMIMELMKNLSDDIVNKKGFIVIYDRGILDRSPWLECSEEDEEISTRDISLIKQLYETDFVNKYKPISYVFYTSPELSVRRKGKPGRLVNVENITRFNKKLNAQEGYINRHSKKTHAIRTDEYEGHIEEFVLDTSICITEDIKEIIKEKLNKREKVNVNSRINKDIGE